MDVSVGAIRDMGVPVRHAGYSHILLEIPINTGSVP